MPTPICDQTVLARLTMVWKLESVGAVAAERPERPTKNRFRSILPEVSACVGERLTRAFTVAVVPFEPIRRMVHVPDVKGNIGVLGARTAKAPGPIGGDTFME